VGREGRGRAPGQRRREGEAESRGAILFNRLGNTLMKANSLPLDGPT
jgi:hypothetical protein